MYYPLLNDGGMEKYDEFKQISNYIKSSSKSDIIEISDSETEEYEDIRMGEINPDDLKNFKVFKREDAKDDLRSEFPEIKSCISFDTYKNKSPENFLDNLEVHVETKIIQNVNKTADMFRKSDESHAILNKSHNTEHISPQLETCPLASKTAKSPVHNHKKTPVPVHAVVDPVSNDPKNVLDKLEVHLEKDKIQEAKKTSDLFSKSEERHTILNDSNFNGPSLPHLKDSLLFSKAEKRPVNNHNINSRNNNNVNNQININNNNNINHLNNTNNQNKHNMHNHNQNNNHINHLNKEKPLAVHAVLHPVANAPENVQDKDVHLGKEKTQKIIKTFDLFSKSDERHTTSNENHFDGYSLPQLETCPLASKTTKSPVHNHKKRPVHPNKKYRSDSKLDKRPNKVSKKPRSTSFIIDTEKKQSLKGFKIPKSNLSVSASQNNRFLKCMQKQKSPSTKRNQDIRKSKVDHQEHLTSVSPNKIMNEAQHTNIEYVCVECSMAFMTVRARETHMKRFHLGLTVDVFSEQLEQAERNKQKDEELTKIKQEIKENSDDEFIIAPQIGFTDLYQNDHHKSPKSSTDVDPQSLEKNLINYLKSSKPIAEIAPSSPVNYHKNSSKTSPKLISDTASELPVNDIKNSHKGINNSKRRARVRHDTSSCIPLGRQSVAEQQCAEAKKYRFILSKLVSPEKKLNKTTPQINRNICKEAPEIAMDTTFVNGKPSDVSFSQKQRWAVDGVNQCESEKVQEPLLNLNNQIEKSFNQFKNYETTLQRNIMIEPNTKQKEQDQEQTVIDSTTVSNDNGQMATDEQGLVSQPTVHYIFSYQQLNGKHHSTELSKSVYLNNFPKNQQNKIIEQQIYKHPQQRYEQPQQKQCQPQHEQQQQQYQQQHKQQQQSPLQQQFQQPDQYKQPQQYQQSIQNTIQYEQQKQQYLQPQQIQIQPPQQQFQPSQQFQQPKQTQYQQPFQLPEQLEPPQKQYEPPQKQYEPPQQQYQLPQQQQQQYQLPQQYQQPIQTQYQPQQQPQLQVKSNGFLYRQALSKEYCTIECQFPNCPFRQNLIYRAPQNCVLGSNFPRTPYVSSEQLQQYYSTYGHIQNQTDQSIIMQNKSLNTESFSNQGNQYNVLPPYIQSYQNYRQYVNNSFLQNEIYDGSTDQNVRHIF